MKIEVTPAQLEAIKKLTDDCASMVGCGEYDSDRIWLRHIRLIDRMLAKKVISVIFTRKRLLTLAMKSCRKSCARRLLEMS